MSTTTLITDVMPDLLPSMCRSEGLHVSDVIHKVCVTYGHYEEDATCNNSERLTLMRTKFNLGHALEWAIKQMLKRQHPSRYIDVGEVERDGVYGTPDIVDTELDAVCEVKLSWLSAGRDYDDDKLWKFWCQLQSYCHMLELRRCVLMVVFANGLWNKGGTGFVSQYREWRTVYSERELAMNWALITSTAKAMEMGRL